MTPPKKIYIGKTIWSEEKIDGKSPAYFSEEAVREAGFAILDQVCKSLRSNYGVCINSARITEDIIQVLKGGENG